MTVLLGSTLKVSLVVLAGLGVAALLRRRSAAARHWVIAASLLCALALPALELVVPAWGRLVRAVRCAAGRRERIVRRAGRRRRRGGRGAPSQPAATAAPAVAGRRAPIVSARHPGVDARRRPRPLRAHRRPDAPHLARRACASGQPRDRGRGWPTRSAASCRSAARCSCSKAIIPSLLVTWGLFVPKVILPRSAQSWTDERAAIVLRHELAHIRRGDWVIQIAGELLRTAYWFNPLVWIACARLRQESEQACDDEVLSSGVDGPDYATHLVELARLLKAEAAPRLPAPAIARSSSLERRIRAMLDARLTRTPATRIGRFMTAGALLTFTVALAAAQTGPVTFSGSVFDSTGAPVPGAAVVLTNTQSKAKFEVASSDSGQFTFVPLPADTYALAASLPGFKKAEDSVTLTGKAVKRDVTLSLGELQETISVRASKARAKSEVVAKKITCERQQA